MSNPSPFEDTAVLIPAYNPDDRLLSLVDELIRAGCRKLVIVDDGSHDESGPVFDALRGKDALVVCKHPQNLGKGAALKTGFRAIREEFASVRGVVTADADGQHLPGDIAKLAQASVDSPEAIHLGCRSFDSGTPLRSLIGNRLTSFFMTFVHGIPLTDTQTGLRYLPFGLLPSLVELSGDGYEYELRCLIQSRRLGVELVEVPITTVYIAGNESSHFMPIADSIRIYSVLFRFGGSSIACFGIDIGLFALLVTSGADAVTATVVARIISGVVNFSINKVFVFRRRGVLGMMTEASRYLALWMLLMIGSAAAVSLVDGHHPGVMVAVKILADISLFLVSYYVQSRFVFVRTAARD